MPPADDSSLTLQATVGLARELALHEVDLKDELLKEKELKEQALQGCITFLDLQLLFLDQLKLLNEFRRTWNANVDDTEIRD